MQVFSLRVAIDHNDIAWQQVIAKALEMRFNEEDFSFGSVVT